MNQSMECPALADNKAVAETYLRHVAAAIDTEKYKAVPAGEYLAELNRRIKNEESV